MVHTTDEFLTVPFACPRFVHHWHGKELPILAVYKFSSQLNYIVRLVWLQFEHAWHHHHLSQCGSYSIERMQALDEYSRHLSKWCIWVVCLILECIPLQNPSNGWKANQGFRTRFSIPISIVGIGFLVQIKEMVPALKISLR